MREFESKDILASSRFVTVDDIGKHYERHNLIVPPAIVALLKEHKARLLEKPLTLDSLGSFILTYDPNSYGLFTHLTRHNNSRLLVDVADRYREEKRVWKSLTSVDVTDLEHNVEVARNQFLQPGVTSQEIPNILVSAVPSLYTPREKGKLEIVFGVDAAIAVALHYHDTQTLPPQNVFVIESLRKG